MRRDEKLTYTENTSHVPFSLSPAYPAMSQVYGIFWDIENCDVPKGKSATAVADVVRRQPFCSGLEEEFRVVCDVFRITKDVLNELNTAQVLVQHVGLSKRRNAADEKLVLAMRHFVELHATDVTKKKVTVVLISGDIDFLAWLSDFKLRNGVYVVLLYNEVVNQDLLNRVDESHDFHGLLTDVPPRPLDYSVGSAAAALASRLPSFQPLSVPTASSRYYTELEVTNLPEWSKHELKIKLEELVKPWDGVVRCVQDRSVVLKFDSKDKTDRAMEDLKAVWLGGRKIQIGYNKRRNFMTQRSRRAQSQSPVLEEMTKQQTDRRPVAAVKAVKQQMCHEKVIRPVVSNNSSSGFPRKSRSSINRDCSVAGPHPDGSKKLSRGLLVQVNRLTDDVGRNQSMPTRLVQDAAESDSPSKKVLPDSTRSHSELDRRNEVPTSQSEDPSSNLEEDFRELRVQEDQDRQLHSEVIVEEGDGGDCHDDEGSHDDVVAIPPSLFPAIAMEIHRIDPGVNSDNGQVLLDQLDEVKRDLTKIIEKKGISVVDLSLVSCRRPAPFKAHLLVPNLYAGLLLIRGLDGMLYGKGNIRIKFARKLDQMRANVVDILRENQLCGGLYVGWSTLCHCYNWRHGESPKKEHEHDLACDEIVMDITRSTETEFKIRDFNKSTTTLLPLQDQVFNYPEKSKTNQLFYCPIHDLRRYRPESENYTLPIVKTSLRNLHLRLDEAVGLHPGGEIPFASLFYCLLATSGDEEIKIDTRTSGGVPLEQLVEALSKSYVVRGTALVKVGRVEREGKKVQSEAAASLERVLSTILELSDHRRLRIEDELETQYFNRTGQSLDDAMKRFGGLGNFVQHSEVFHIIGKKSLRELAPSHDFQRNLMLVRVRKMLAGLEEKCFLLEDETFGRLYHKLITDGRTYRVSDFGVCSLTDLLSSLMSTDQKIFTVSNGRVFLSMCSNGLGCFFANILDLLKKQPGFCCSLDILDEAYICAHGDYSVSAFGYTNLGQMFQEFYRDFEWREEGQEVPLLSLSADLKLQLFGEKVRQLIVTVRPGRPMSLAELSTAYSIYCRDDLALFLRYLPAKGGLGEVLRRLDPAMGVVLLKGRDGEEMVEMETKTSVATSTAQVSSDIPSSTMTPRRSLVKVSRRSRVAATFDRSMNSDW